MLEDSDEAAVRARGSMVADDELVIPLAGAIRALRRELLEAVQAGGDEEIRFALGPVELELQVEASRELGGETGVKFWLVSVAGKGGRSSSSSHTVRLTLTPVRVDPETAEQGDLMVSSDLEERG